MRYTNLKYKPWFESSFTYRLLFFLGLFNLRANDISYNPFFVSYAIVEESSVTYVTSFTSAKEVLFLFVCLVVCFVKYYLQVNNLF